jgi:HEAT repeat protein
MDHLIRSAFPLLQGLYNAPLRWRFDLPSALIGAAAALLLVGLIYTFRDALRRAWEAFLVPLRRLSHYLLAGAEETYREQVVSWARSFVIPARAAALDDVFVEPALLAPLPSPKSVSEVDPHVGPPLVPLRQTLERHPRLVIRGEAGMGKTTALAYLALVCARMEDSETVPPAAQGRLPLYVSLPALNWGEAEQGGERKKPSAVRVLIDGAVAASGGGSGLTAPLRKYLETGHAIVLADGWDELLPSQRQQATTWLAELADALPGNLWLVGAGMRDYGRLTECGFVPLTLAEWDAGQVETFAQRWTAACAPEGEATPALARELAAGLRQAARGGAPPLELALLTFVHLADRQPLASGRAALFDRALELLLRHEQKQAQEEDPVLLAACRVTLGQVALALQQENRATASRAEIEAAIEAALPPPEERPPRAIARAFRALVGGQGLFRRVGAGRYAFAHSLWQAYLAARQLVAIAPASIAERLEDPRWADVLRFYAELGDMAPLVATWLRTPDDVFCTRLCTLGAWIGAAPEGTAWRDGAMAVLARALLQPGRLAMTRQALAKALAMSGVSGVAYFLKQALQHPDAEVRIAAAIGLAQVAGEADLPAFEAAMKDEEPAVREGAVRAMATLGIDAARRRLEQMLLEGDDELRLIAGEALAGCGNEGVDFLREMAEAEDVVIRRAAVVGLGLAGARDVLERVARDDGQWIVRSAATSALEEIGKRQENAGIPPPPEVEQLPWLISWAAGRGEGVGLGEAARLMLRRALGEGDETVRLVAARTLAQIGQPEDVEALHGTLADPDRDVVDAAAVALPEIIRRYDLKIERK